MGMKKDNGKLTREGNGNLAGKERESKAYGDGNGGWESCKEADQRTVKNHITGGYIDEGSIIAAMMTTMMTTKTSRTIMTMMTTIRMTSTTRMTTMTMTMMVTLRTTMTMMTQMKLNGFKLPRNDYTW